MATTPKYKYANTSLVIGWNGSVVRVHEGEAWDANDPFVKANKGFFNDSPAKVRRTVAAPVAAPIETADAPPEA